jgi:hypothetical protein
VIQGNQKSKGNAFETKTARQLSLWMFNDPKILSRSLGSGSVTTRGYLGDIVPIKQMPILNDWIFLIEAKHGYKDQISTLTNQTLIKKWLDKLILEKKDLDLIILLIVKFHMQPTLIITDKKLNNIEFNLILNYNSVLFYIYKFEEVIQKDFITTFGVN